ncbi:Oxysterol-binding protein [Aureobasidium subglaciale]|nr:Oxysterol-binding protein [Aureobasidium subglaciale]KAI5213722.1 Oxysterol-binding protein [Aureobasidium subglaciale]KAI5253530.1 Oxysterol-binding protein [Aureobasidium subglaciale]
MVIHLGSIRADAAETDKWADEVGWDLEKVFEKHCGKEVAAEPGLPLNVVAKRGSFQCRHHQELEDDDDLYTILLHTNIGVKNIPHEQKASSSPTTLNPEVKLQSTSAGRLPAEQNTLIMADGNRSTLKEFIASISTIRGDLSNITAPPFLLASQSTVEFPSYWCERPQLLCAPASEPDAQKRCLLVLKWFLASLKRQQYAGRDESAGVKKPLNAFLGEVFMGAWGGSDGEGRTCLISEQVRSHHPPVTACYLWNDEQGVRAEGYACQNITFSGTVNIKQIGHAIIHLDKWNEDYLVPLPSVKVSGLITGTPYPELVGSYDIVSSAGYVASVDFSGKRFLGLAGKKNSLHAALYSADDTSRKHPIYTLDGNWNGVFTIRDEKADSVVEEFDTNAHPPLPVQVPDESTLDPYESRKAWGPTISALNSGDMQAVVDAKSKVEQGQREMRKQEEAAGKTWTPLFFQQVQREERLDKLKSIAHGDAEMDGTQGIWRWVGSEKAEQVDRPFHGDLVPWLT